MTTVISRRKEEKEDEQEQDQLGIIVGLTTPAKVRFESKRPVSIGEYITFNFNGNNNKKVLGLVEKSIIDSDALSDSNIHNFAEAFESKKVAERNSRDRSYRVDVRVIGYVNELKKNKAILPSIPPDPGTEVYEATTKDLSGIFAPDGDNWLRAGSLLRNNDVDVKINIDKVVSRHLAVLAMTGQGKSNLVTVLAKELSNQEGTMVIFDYHGDYSTLSSIRNINLIQARINPRFLDHEKLAGVIEIRENASNQIQVLSKAFTEDVKQHQDTDFWEYLKKSVSDVGSDNKNRYAKEADKVNDKIDYARRKFHNILDPSVTDPLTFIRNGKINVINLVEFTERQANTAVSFYLEELLEQRKFATRQNKKDPVAPRFPIPILAVIEEAHVFIPKDDNTDSKYLATKIAREGRKFGLGLVIVSQRPRGIDVNILSQMGSLAVMKMVQRDDQTQVSAASETLSGDLTEQLTSLNPGQAIFSGQWVNLPAFVKVEEFKGRKVGVDISATQQWKSFREEKKITAKESSDAYIPDGYIQD
jgi:DNA helicase HerA-like ATPase